MQETTQTAEVIDTGVMPTVHTFFRREFRLAGAAVRRVADGDTGRARVLADHLEFVCRHLHHHHTAEDVLLWPALLERVPAELAPIVHLMESQHASVDRLLAAIQELLPPWASAAAAADGERLADLLDELYVHLAEHLDAEEERLLPIAARAMTSEEWTAMGELARKDTPRSEMTLVFGMIQHDGDPEVVAGMLADAPAPVRWLVPRLSRRAFRRHTLRVHGTASP